MKKRALNRNNTAVDRGKLISLCNHQKMSGRPFLFQVEKGVQIEAAAMKEPQGAKLNVFLQHVMVVTSHIMHSAAAAAHTLAEPGMTDSKD